MFRSQFLYYVFFNFLSTRGKIIYRGELSLLIENIPSIKLFSFIAFLICIHDTSRKHYILRLNDKSEQPRSSCYLQENRPPREAALVLKNGEVFKGTGFGASKIASGEVVFNTAFANYPDSLTDPSYNGQILTLTTPLVGNYGVPSYDLKDEWGLPFYFESNSIKAEGLVVFECCKQPSHHASSKTLDTWLMEEGIPGIEGIDTRRLTKLLRSHGVMLGLIAVAEEDNSLDIEELKRKAASVPDPNLTRKLVEEVCVKEHLHYKGSDHPGKHPTVVLVDCGLKNNIIRSLLKRGMNVIVVPYTIQWNEIVDINPDGIVFSNGPGDPKDCTITIETMASAISEGLPTFGICLGNQIMGLAVEGDTYKLKFGHRAANKPVIDLSDPQKHAYITSQNHGFCVDRNTLPDDVELYFICADDDTLEGIKHVKQPVFAVQFHPEATPGPYDTEFLFDMFQESIDS
ncbi:glutamine-hydrolyzing carbamoyl-phosphate synthase small subunit [Candidatus Bathyarchaeota archaeon]|nr:glutamine-hydrolyzing carbamoyl-phosphate synthase small subunit [Candidatus Bathyarchaeota archaeon]